MPGHDVEWEIPGAFRLAGKDAFRQGDGVVGRSLATEGAHAAQSAHVVVEGDRHRAFEIAASHARPGDVLVVAGRGSEQRLVSGDSVRMFDDREELERALQRMQRSVRRTRTGRETRGR